MKFIIEYRSALSGHASPVFRTALTTPNKTATLEQFYSTDDQDWEVISVKAARRER